MNIQIDVKKIGTWLGLIGGAITVFTFVVDWRISQLEARMVDRFALLREINTLRDNVAYLEAEMQKHHMTGPPSQPEHYLPEPLAPEALSPKKE